METNTTAKDCEDVVGLFEDKELRRICEEYESQQISKKEAHLGFNAFTLVSDTFYHENFHSDVLAAFFDMQSAHGEQRLFLHQFIQLLRTSKPELADAINPDDFKNYKTERESGRIDIRVLDTKSRKAIVVENKINNAGDMPRQLPRYVEDTEKNGEFKVVAIVYLSLDGSKYPSKHDWIDGDEAVIEPKLIQLAAFSNGSKSDLLTGWVYPCLPLISSADALIVLRQYGRLLQYLGANTMNHPIMETFHSWLLKDTNKYKRALALRQMLGDIPAYLCTKIMDRYQAPACAPFEKVSIYHECVVFNRFLCGKWRPQIEIYCSAEQISVEVLDWDWRENKSVLMTQAVTEIELLGQFDKLDEKLRSWPVYVKVFEFPSKEAALFDFMDQVLQRFRELKKRNL